MLISDNPRTAPLVDITSQSPLPTKQGTGSPDTRLETHNLANFTETNNDQRDNNRYPRNLWQNFVQWITAPITRFFGGSSSQGNLPNFQKEGWTRQASEESHVTIYSKTFDQPYEGEGKIEIKYEVFNDKPVKMTRTELDKDGNPTKSSADHYNEYPNVAKTETITYRDGQPSLRTDDIYTVTGKWVRRESYAMGEDNQWRLRQPDSFAAK